MSSTEPRRACGIGAAIPSTQSCPRSASPSVMKLPGSTALIVTPRGVSFVAEARTKPNWAALLAPSCAHW